MENLSIIINDNESKYELIIKFNNISQIMDRFKNQTILSKDLNIEIGLDLLGLIKI